MFIREHADLIAFVFLQMCVCPSLSEYMGWGVGTMASSAILDVCQFEGHVSKASLHTMLFVQHCFMRSKTQREGGKKQVPDLMKRAVCDEFHTYSLEYFIASLPF